MHTPCRRRRTDQGPVPAVEPARLHCVAIAVLMKLTPPSPAGSVTGWCSIWGMCSRTTTGGGGHQFAQRRGERRDRGYEGFFSQVQCATAAVGVTSVLGQAVPRGLLDVLFLLAQYQTRSVALGAVRHAAAMLLGVSVNRDTLPSAINALDKLFPDGSVSGVHSLPGGTYTYNLRKRREVAGWHRRKRPSTPVPRDTASLNAPRALGAPWHPCPLTLTRPLHLPSQSLAGT